MNSLIDLHSEAPAPLELFEKEVIHEDNQLLVANRLEVFKPILPRGERRRLRRRAKVLWKQLNAAGYNRLCQIRHDLYTSYLEVKSNFTDLKEQYQLARELPDPDVALLKAMRDELMDLARQGRALAVQGRKVNEQIEAMDPLYQEYRTATGRLEAHDIATAELKEQKREEKRYVKESKIIQSLIEDALRRTPGCHHLWYDSRNRRHADIPILSRAGFNGDSHWFLLEASEKTTFGWRTLLPYGVTVDALVNDRTLNNLSVAVNRQIEVRRASTGAQIYFLVNRLDSPDGLPRRVLFGQMFDFYPTSKHHLMPWPAGVMAGRRIEWKTFAEIPHVLIAGSSQSGKSNEINCIIATLVTMNSPAECRLILVDNKGGVEFTHWRELPHLLTPMVKMVDNVLPALQLAERMMHKRLAMLEAVKAKDITAYNKRVATSERWARVVVVIDELATLLDQGPLTKDIHASMKILTAMGRACGIHMVMCTQYSGVDVLPGPIKANLAARMSGAMPDGSASMTVLGTHEAKELQRIPGRMLIAVGADSKEIQTAYISDFDIERAVAKAKEYGPAPEVPELQGLGAEPDNEDFIPVRVLTRNDVMDLALDCFSGQLSSQKMHKYLEAEAASPGQRAIQKVVQKVIDHAPIEYKGITYSIERKGRAYYLAAIERSDDQTALPGRQIDVTSMSGQEEETVYA